MCATVQPTALHRYQILFLEEASRVPGGQAVLVRATVHIFCNTYVMSIVIITVIAIMCVVELTIMVLAAWIC